MTRRFSDCSSCGKLMMLVGVLVATPLTVLPFYPEDVIYALSFLIPASGSIFLGTILCLFGRRDGDGGLEWRSSIQRSSLTVLFAWSWGIFIGALPFVISRQLTVLQAFFESVSGWTTTGLSVMDVTITPKIFLFHRSFMQFCGGLGFVMMMVMFVSGKQSMNLYSAEGHPDKLMPNLKKTAQTVFAMYSSFLVVGTAAYRIAGMELFDAIMHTMCALSTGGFSTRLNSIGEYNNFSIEVITIVLMLIGTTNFAVLLLLAKRKWRQFVRVSEIRFMFLLLLLFVPLTAISLSYGLGISLEQGLRKASFDIVSALSTTGYSTMSYTSWPPFAIGVLILMMLIGGGMGSTAGGIKLSRVYIMLRLAALDIRRRLTPARNVEAPYYIKAQGKTPIDASLTADTTGFAVCYLVLFLTGSLLTTVTADCGLTEGMFEFASALGTVGLSIGLTGPATGAGTLIVEMFGMIMGRLEIFIVLIALYSGVSILRQGFHKTED
ncbi:TrkH family potassium uptake protein [Lacrimispora saccharolytica]|uniref:Cation transporter n=1 Tax=Lacrimispora saccharolytica (strain ATCC 35040 / DSM 2544 / NRCC 2533 / WM1) TaxID=610130 RepID=D9R751_LACSW|nr:potassium transporter TrkG [Lacrimispora saccharolytica]ADL05483.1 cation transporter [[Clostridium] saccharolyticum WM1]QRV20357.1 TrkH family potassium uptake protein [Lacrimispora saccharolytica]